MGAVTTADVLRAAREHIKLEKLRIVVVGEAGLRGKLEEMEFGPVDVRTETATIPR